MKEIAGLKTFTLDEVREQLGVSRRTVQTYVLDGRIKAVKVAGRWVITEDNLRDFINGREQK